MRPFHSTVALALALLTAAPAAPQTPATTMDASAQSSFTVFVRAVPVGSIRTSVTASADGWTIETSGRLGAPMGIVARRVEIRYDRNWLPQSLTIDATARGEQTSIHTVFENGTAHEEATIKGIPKTTTEPAPADAIILPNPFFGAYEALAARLATAPQGSTLHVYAAPGVQFDAKVGGSSSETLQTAERVIKARLTTVTFMPPGQPPVEATVLADETGRLLRLEIPAQALQVVREDIAAVSTRRLTVSRPNDEDVNVPANGFSLAGTLSTPAAPAGTPRARKLPAIVLVGPPSLTDRDAVTAGIPVLGELAGALADAGFAVLRYDNRGVGQSGGRPDAATLADYADDARAAVKYLADRKDVDRDRVALIGYGEGGYVAMLTAAKEKKVKALILVDAPGTTGAALILARQQHALDRMQLPDAEKQKRIALQKQIQQAVVSGKGWEGVPLMLRQQSDTPLFKSLLTFDPAEVMKDIRQPIFILQGGLDREVPPDSAADLETLAKGRHRKDASVDLLRLPDLNHLLVPAKTGEADEYGQLSGEKVSPQVGSGIAAWLNKVLPARH
ncbi:MAG: alpha/beta fold hydrolase [Acidobacteriota bacterium]|nr:alpha/beta fold hydrolase [Acidobacteriota bacterium]